LYINTCEERRRVEVVEERNHLGALLCFVEH